MKDILDWHMLRKFAQLDEDTVRYQLRTRDYHLESITPLEKNCPCGGRCKCEKWKKAQVRKHKLTFVYFKFDYCPKCAEVKR